MERSVYVAANREDELRSLEVARRHAWDSSEERQKSPEGPERVASKEILKEGRVLKDWRGEMRNRRGNKVLRGGFEGEAIVEGNKAREISKQPLSKKKKRRIIK